MPITLDIKPEVQAELARQAAEQGRPIETVAAALLEATVIREEPDRGVSRSSAPPEVAAACEQLKTFGKRHGLSLGGMTLRELRHQARP